MNIEYTCALCNKPAEYLFIEVMTKKCPANGSNTRILSLCRHDANLEKDQHPYHEVLILKIIKGKYSTGFRVDTNTIKETK